MKCSKCGHVGPMQHIASGDEQLPFLAHLDNYDFRSFAEMVERMPKNDDPITITQEPIYDDRKTPGWGMLIAVASAAITLGAIFFFAIPAWLDTMR